MKIPLLDHGYIEFVEHWGSDERIIEAARMSTNKGFMGWGGAACPDCSEAGRLDPVDNLLKSTEMFHQAMDVCKCKGKGTTSGDEKLLKYLYTNNHSTPFEMGGFVIEVQAPIFVFREWHRHRTQSYSELSARYSPLPDFNYVPTVERLMLNSKTNKQAGVLPGAKELTLEEAEIFRQELITSYAASQGLYEKALSMGIPKELARVHLPVARYSRMRASTNLRNWLGFLTLRMADNAQWEIREYANTVASIVEDKFPRTYALFAKKA